MIKWLKALVDRWRGIREREHSERHVMHNDQTSRRPEVAVPSVPSAESSSSGDSGPDFFGKGMPRTNVPLVGLSDSGHTMPAGTWDEFSGFYHIIPPDTTDALAERRAKAEELLKKLEA